MLVFSKKIEKKKIRPLKEVSPIVLTVNEEKIRIFIAKDDVISNVVRVGVEAPDHVKIDREER